MTVSLKPSEAEVLAARALESIAARQQQPVDPTVKIIAGARHGVDGYTIDLTDDQADSLRSELEEFVADPSVRNGHPVIGRAATADGRASTTRKSRAVTPEVGL